MFHDVERYFTEHKPFSQSKKQNTNYIMHNITIIIYRTNSPMSELVHDIIIL